MRRGTVATRSRKRRAITRRDWTSDWRRGAARRTWIGSRARASATRPLFFALSAQHVKRSRAAAWLGAGAAALGMLSWGVLAALLGA
jgi:hypothetical protein